MKKEPTTLRNTRRRILMMDCCEICGLVTEKWEICQIHKVPVLACAICQIKFSTVLHPVRLDELDDNAEAAAA